MKILIQGDSHIAYFRNAANKGLLSKKHTYDIQHVNAATAHGMNNPNSKTMALEKFKERLLKTNPDILITHLGEVDCGFVIWYWYERKERTIEEQIEVSLNSYFKYLNEAKGVVKNVIVTSPTLPTIKDGDLFPEHKVANARKEIKATMRERTELTLQYNEMLRQRCGDEGHIFVDCTTELLTHEGVIDDYYQDLTKPHDHHLDATKMAPIWSNKLNPILEKI